MAANRWPISVSRYQSDIDLAKRIDGNIATRSADLEYANEQFKPQPYVTKHAASIYATQDQKAVPRSESLRAGAVINGAAVNTTWVKVTLARGRTGVVLASDLDLQAATIVRNRSGRHTPPPSAKGDPVAEGCFTNLSKRADFDDLVQVASSNTSGFELSGS